MSAVPAVVAVTTPDVFAVIVPLLLLQFPPGVASLNVVESLKQNAEVPVMVFAVIVDCTFTVNVSELLPQVLAVE